MKKFLKHTFIAIISILVIAFIALKIFSEKLPVSNLNGDPLAQKMLKAVNKEAFDSLAFLGWNFNNMHYYIWDKEANRAIIFWEEIKVYMDLNKIAGKVFDKGVEITDESIKKKIIKKAWAYWCNDSFWVLAPFKIFDKGTKRYVIKDDKGKESLLVSYESGGVTPGDSYLWILDENYRPLEFKMWVKIIPLKGMKATWGDWVTLTSGAQYSTTHQVASYKSKVIDIIEGSSFKDYYEEWK